MVYVFSQKGATEFQGPLTTWFDLKKIKMGRNANQNGGIEEWEEIKGKERRDEAHKLGWNMVWGGP